MYVPNACPALVVRPIGQPSSDCSTFLVYGNQRSRYTLPQCLRAVVVEALATRSAFSMSTDHFAGVASRESSGIAKQTPQEFPQCPGEDLHAHAATQFIEAVEVRWAARGLLAVANGGRPAAAKAISDIDLALLPALATGSRDYNRREEARIKVMAQNASNAQKRIQIELDAWTELYTDLHRRGEP